MATMPNVTGLQWQDALNFLVQAGIRVLPLGYFQVDPVTFTYQQNKAVKPGFVISQTPSSGTTGVVPNSAVQLSISGYKVGVAYPAGGGNT